MRENSPEDWCSFLSLLRLTFHYFPQIIEIIVIIYAHASISVNRRTFKSPNWYVVPLSIFAKSSSIFHFIVKLHFVAMKPYVVHTICRHAAEVGLVAGFFWLSLTSVYWIGIQTRVARAGKSRGRSHVWNRMFYRRNHTCKHSRPIWIETERVRQSRGHWMISCM